MNFVFKSELNHINFIGKFDVSKAVRIGEFDCDCDHCIFEKGLSGKKKEGRFFIRRFTSPSA